MKKEKKREIYSVYDELCDRDPEWKRPAMIPRFKILYLRWREIELEKKIHSAPFYTRSWQRAWLPLADFERFREYAMQ